MANAYVQSKSASADAGATSIAATWNSDTTTGNYIHVSVYFDSALDRNSSVTDSQSNTYTAIRWTSNAGNGYSLKTWYAKNITGGTTPTVTANFSSAPSLRRIIIVECSGGDLVDLLQQETGRFVDPASTTPSSGSVTTTTSGEMVISSVVYLGSGTITPGGGFTEREEISGTAVETQVQTLAGSIDGTWNFSPAGKAYVNIATFKAAASIAPMFRGS